MSVALLIPRPAEVRTNARGTIRHQLTETMWRITRPRGEVLGYVEAIRPGASRFRAKRMTPDRRRFLPCGETGSFEEAIDALQG